MATKKKNRKGISGNPAKKARQARQVTKASQWGRIATVDLLLPSGNVALVRRPGLVELLGAGVFPDELLSFVQKSMDNAKLRLQGKTPEDGTTTPKEEIEMLSKDPESIAKMYKVFDMTCAYSVVEPPVAYHMTREDKLILESERDPDVVYTDRILDADKIFIFNFVVGGTSDLSRFRDEQSAVVANLSDGQDVPSEAELVLPDGGRV